MELPVQMEIFLNKWMTLGGIALFPFQPVGTEIKFHLHKISISPSRESAPRLHQLLESSRSTNETSSFPPRMEKAFPFGKENFRDLKPKILA